MPALPERRPTYFRGNPEVTYEWSDAYASFTRRPLDPTATRHRHLGVRAGHTVSGYVGILRAGCPRSRKDGRTYFRGNPEVTPEVTYEWSDAYASFTRRPLDPTATRHRHLGVRAGHTVSGYVGILRAGCPRSRKDGQTYFRGNPEVTYEWSDAYASFTRRPLDPTATRHGTSACGDTPSPGTWASRSPDPRLGVRGTPPYFPSTRWRLCRRLSVCWRTSIGQRPRSTASAHAGLFNTSGLSIS